jgi:CheY-like chemotaxis protein/anti-sigma regulatory factor (Ser/Thr protein kinase)
LAQVLEHVLSLKSVRAHAKGLQLRVLEGAQVPQYCEGDSTRLSQILLNLLSNAIRYTDHGEIVLRLDVQDHHLCCEVTDTGIGMGPEQIDKLFKPFSQVHTRPASQVEGFGLGLAITQRLVRLMNGDIQVHSSPGAGSQFSVRLPLNAAEPADLRHLRTVALVGLEADERECLQSELSQRGCEVHDAQTAPEPPQPMPQVIVLGPVAARMTDAQQMCQWVDAGVTVLLSGPPGATPDLPPRLHDDAFLAGPLSALRLANAVERQLRTPAPNASGRLLDLRVLAAEDNPVNRMVLGQMLEQEGAHVTFATDGEEAVAAVREQGAAAFDLMLCDIQMPIMDGYEATRLIHDLAPHLPVVGLTAHAFASAKRQAREAGMVDYVTKPYLLDTLVDVVRRHVGAPRPTALPCPVNSSPPSSPVSPFSPFPKAASANAAHLTPVNTTTAPTLCTSDFQQMQKHFSSQPLLLERLVGMLSRTLNELDAELGAALSARNFTTLSKVAHNIKGTALNLHAPELTRLAMQTQDEARQTQDQAWQSGHALQASLRQFLSEAAQ